MRFAPCTYFAFFFASLSSALLTWTCCAAEPDLTLAEEGKSAYVIVHDEAAPESVHHAARELQHYLKAVASVDVAIKVSPEEPAAPFIALGDTAAARGAGVLVNELPLEGFRIVSRDKNLFIVGSDTADKKRTPQGGTSNGTLNGVYCFIEEALNVRWLLPGELGEDFTQQKNVSVRPIDRTESPAFLNRRVPGIQNNLPAVQQWSSRHKLGFSLHLEHSHSWQRVVPEAMHDQHPEWFAEIGGRRGRPIGDRYKLETTNPELIQHFANAAMDAFRRDPDLTVFSLSPTDSDNWSTSPESRALYDKDPHGKLSVTPLILKFYNEVAKIVRREFPERKLAGYIYASYLYPPSGGMPRLEPNLFLVTAPSISYGYQLYRDSVKKDWDQLMQTWSAKTSQIAYYDLFNWLKGSSGAITPPAPEILNFAFPRLSDYGIKGVYIYGTEEWSQAAVNNYVIAKMTWNPKLDANALCEEFYRRAYGPDAGKIIGALYERLDAAVKTFYNKDRTANYTATPQYMSSVLASNYSEIESAYLKARASAAAASPAQQARLEFLGDNLLLLQWQLRGQGFLPENKTSALYRTDAEIEKLLGRTYPAFGVALAPRLKRTEKVFAPLSATWEAPLPHARPKTPLSLRGNARFLVFPKSDDEIQVSAKSLAGRGTLVRCEAYTASGSLVGSGILRAGAPFQFPTAAGQLYYVEISAGSSSAEIEISGAPHALAADSNKGRVHVQGKSTPFYFHVPADAPNFTLTISSGAPGETSLSHLYSPSGKLVRTLDTQTVPVAREEMTKANAAGDWEGFWCLSVEKAPAGSFDDVFIGLEGNFPKWYTVNAEAPLVLSALETVKQ